VFAIGWCLGGLTSFRPSRQGNAVTKYGRRNHKMNRPCDMCGGSGQLAYFKGESRFLLSQVDCPNCCGTGCTETDEADQDESGATQNGDAK